MNIYGLRINFKITEMKTIKVLFRTLLDDRSALRTKIDEMHRDMIILSNTLDSMDTKLHRYALANLKFLFLRLLLRIFFFSDHFPKRLPEKPN